jgi:hypothetical protein
MSYLFSILGHMWLGASLSWYGINFPSSEFMMIIFPNICFFELSFVIKKVKDKWRGGIKKIKK